MKEAIIYEKGLSGKKFDKKEIKDAEKIVDNFNKNAKKKSKGQNP